MSHYRGASSLKISSSPCQTLIIGTSRSWICRDYLPTGATLGITGNASMFEQAESTQFSDHGYDSGLGTFLSICRPAPVGHYSGLVRLIRRSFRSFYPAPTLYLDLDERSGGSGLSTMIVAEGSVRSASVDTPVTDLYFKDGNVICTAHVPGSDRFVITSLGL